MSTTIQKRADELKPGDVMIYGDDRCSVLQIVRDPVGAKVKLCALPEVGEVAELAPAWIRLNSAPIEVEAPALTPAQQHAEELAELLRTAVTVARQGASRVRQWVIDAEELLKTFEPPEPPTLEEALDALNAVAGMPGAFACKEMEMADAVLDRARRAGLLK